ncbi:hypothetical protein V6N13_093694 [Hibiscus sabdariffa]|uniref:Uncharacterized protein n=2 Tax=Hibiscus sabdariffa TaxID=183260 RepID=A0ABR2NGA9_9ROSI
MATRSCLYAFLVLVASQSSMIQAQIVIPPPQCRPVLAVPLEKIAFLVNLIIYKAEFFLRASFGAGIDSFSPGLVQGPVPFGGEIARVENETRAIIQELGLQSVGHLRAIVNTTLLSAPLARPQIDMSVETFNAIILEAFDTFRLLPPFSVYHNDESLLYAAGAVSSLLHQYLTGLIPQIIGFAEQQLVAGIAVSEAVGFGVIRAQLNVLVDERVSPYVFDIKTLVNNTANLTNFLGGCGVKDEGLVVPEELGAENRTTTNVVPADVNSLAQPRYEREILRIVFTTGNATVPGGFFPNGFNGTLYQRIVALGLS